MYPERSFQYFFIDDYYDRQFKSELQFGKIFGIFSGIAILLACLGIFGMTVFHASSRLKEISIRKVLGASVQNLLLLLSGDYIKVVVLFAMIAWPLIYFSARSWLQNYPIRVNMSAIFFVVPIILIIAMVVVTSFVQTFKAACANPVDRLRSE